MQLGSSFGKVTRNIGETKRKPCQEAKSSAVNLKESAEMSKELKSILSDHQ